ncbi:hypothetical protein [Sphingorhabdus sp. Alg231-15]|uniref:hypothetical protein n=1 Tax=Sphingorhabdus sp. Alg231-15 TaxID=1922222 RepID=UPI00307C0A4E
MTDRTKKEELNEQELDEVAGGVGGVMGDEPAMIKKSGNGKIIRPTPKGMERVFDDE